MNQTPDEIKRRLNDPIHVHYHISDIEPRLTPLALHDLEFLHEDALALIQQLQAELEDMTARYKIADDCTKKKGEMNEKLYAELTAVKAERDAAVNDIKRMVHDNTNTFCYYCEMAKGGCEAVNCRGRNAFEWRGVQKEETT